MKTTNSQYNTPVSKSQKEMVERFIRVNHAGEFGAKRIYEGQLAVLGKTADGDTIKHMKEQEQVHLTKFESLIAERQVRPTILYPIWEMAGFALGLSLIHI